MRGILVQARSGDPEPRCVCALFRPIKPKNSSNDATRRGCVRCPCRRAEEASIRQVDRTLSEAQFAKQALGKATELQLGFACSIARDDDHGGADEYGNESEKSQ
jgi:hypothetical protein